MVGWSLLTVQQFVSSINPFVRASMCVCVCAQRVWFQRSCWDQIRQWFLRVVRLLLRILIPVTEQPGGASDILEMLTDRIDVDEYNKYTRSTAHAVC